MDEKKVREAIKIMKNERPGCGEKIVYPEGERCNAYNLAIEALKKQLPKKPIEDEEQNIRYITTYICPHCKNKFTGIISMHCYHCGQKFDWSK